MIAPAGGSTFPQIFIGETHIGGCDELYALDREGKLDAHARRREGDVMSDGPQLHRRHGADAHRRCCRSRASSRASS